METLCKLLWISREELLPGSLKVIMQESLEGFLKEFLEVSLNKFLDTYLWGIFSGIPAAIPELMSDGLFEKTRVRISERISRRLSHGSL